MLHVYLDFIQPITTNCGEHVATDWQVATDSSFNSIISSSMNDYVHKERISLEIPETLVGQTVYVRARIKGNEAANTSECIGPWSASASLTYWDEDEIKLLPVPKIKYDYGTYQNTNGTYSTGWFIVLENPEDFRNLSSYYPWAMVLEFEKLIDGTGFLFQVSFNDTNGQPLDSVAYWLDQNVYDGAELILKAKVQVKDNDSGNVFDTNTVSMFLNPKPDISVFNSTLTISDSSGDIYRTPIIGLNQSFAYTQYLEKTSQLSIAPTIYYVDSNMTVTPYPALPAEASGVTVENLRLIRRSNSLSNTDKSITVILGTNDSNTGDRDIKYYFYDLYGNSWIAGTIPNFNNQILLDAKIIEDETIVIITNDLNVAPTTDILRTFKIYYDPGFYVSGILESTEIPVYSQSAAASVPNSAEGFTNDIFGAVCWGGRAGKVYISGISVIPGVMPDVPVFEVDLVSGNYNRITSIPIGLKNFVGEKLDNDSFYVIGTNKDTTLPEAYIYTISKDIWKQAPINVSGGSFDGSKLEITKNINNEIIVSGCSVSNGSSYTNFIKTGN